MTEQEEFLETLKNPTKARLTRAVKDFQQNHGESIRETHITQSIEQACVNEFSVNMIGDNYIALLEKSLVFGDSLRQFMLNPDLKGRTFVDENNEGPLTYYQVTFYVTEA